MNDLDMHDPEFPDIHPRLASALRAIDDGDAKPLVAIAAKARIAQDEGRYCECAEPLLDGGLMCQGCLLNNHDEEVEMVHAIVDAHEWVPDESTEARKMMRWCAICTNPEKAPRHHGAPAVGRTSRGVTVQGVRP